MQSTSHPTMESECFKHINQALANWSDVDIRTVPDVMYQIRCGEDEHDSSIEYQINWFLDCTETLIHNHRHTFDTYCLEGEYLEKLWEIVDDGQGDVTYRFCRQLGNTFDTSTTIPGTLQHVRSRHHFPGNQMHVDTTQFHSITPLKQSNTRIFTFLRKQNHFPGRKLSFLSSSSIIDGPTNEIRSATDEERLKMYNKLQDILRTRFQHYIEGAANNL